MREIKFGKFRISLPFVLLICLMVVLDENYIFVTTFFAILIHELAHIAAVRICGGKIDGVDVRVFGIRINVPELKLLSYKKEIIIAAAGPVAGIIAAISGAAAASAFGLKNTEYFVGVNIVITAINLIPVFPLDGGRITLSLLLLLFPVRAAYVISYILSIFSIAALFSLCVFLAMHGILNPSLVIFSIYVAVCGIRLRPLL